MNDLAEPRGSRRHPWRRLVAGAIDGCCIGAWVVLVAVVGIGVYLLLGAHGRLASELQENLIAFVVTIAPVTLGMTLAERRGGATVGKRVAGIRIVRASDGARPSFPRLLGRNCLKFGVPWTIAHAAVFALVDSSAAGSPAPWVLVVLLLAYVLPVLYVASLFIGGGRTPYDRLLDVVIEDAEAATTGQAGAHAGAGVSARRS